MGTRPSDVNKDDMNYYIFYNPIFGKKCLEKVTKAWRTPRSQLIDQNMAPALLLTLQLYVFYANSPCTGAGKKH